MMNILKTRSGKALASLFAVAAVAAITPSDSFAKTMQPNDKQREQAIAEGYDANILQDYWPYFEYAKKQSGGSCCGFKDAMIVDPADVQETGDPTNPYRILIRRTSSGLKLQEPYWITMDAGMILDQTQSAKICETYNEAAEAKNIDAFCSVPPFPVVFLNDGSSYDPASGMHTVNGKKYPVGHIVTTEQRKASPFRYCFQPAPEGF